MLSLLLITVSILLVGAAGFAALYFTGTIFRDAGATGGAAALNSQAQQLIQAVDAFREDLNRWPNDAQELVSSGYLQGEFLPVEGTSGGWMTPLNGQPVYQMRNVPDRMCEELNKQLQLPAATPSGFVTGQWLQCYGAESQTGGYKVLLVRGPGNLSKVQANPLAASVLAN